MRTSKEALHYMWFLRIESKDLNLMGGKELGARQALCLITQFTYANE